MWLIGSASIAECVDMQFGNVSDVTAAKQFQRLYERKVTNGVWLVSKCWLNVNCLKHREVS